MNAHNEQQPAAAQKAVAEVLSCRVGNDTSTIDKAFPAGTKLYAAPVTAAPTLDDELAQDRMSELCKLESDVLDVLPSVYYMDPPDGGDVSLGEQVKRMAEDAALWRKHISTPAAPGIDLARVQAALKYAEAAARHNTHTELAADFADLIRRIDASPKGDEAAPLHAHYCNAQPASAACICGLDSPKGGSEARDAERYRKLRRMRINPYAVLPVGEALDAHVDAMQAQAGDAEVRP